MGAGVGVKLLHRCVWPWAYRDAQKMTLTLGSTAAILIDNICAIIYQS